MRSGPVHLSTDRAPTGREPRRAAPVQTPSLGRGLPGSRTLTPQALLSLQRMTGNETVARMLQKSGLIARPVQTQQPVLQRACQCAGKCQSCTTRRDEAEVQQYTGLDGTVAQRERDARSGRGDHMGSKSRKDGRSLPDELHPDAGASGIASLRATTPAQRAAIPAHGLAAQRVRENADNTGGGQTLTGASPGLKSSRFKGSLKLEACFENRDRLRLGEPDRDATARIQNALLEVPTKTGNTYDLGPTGADGIYGHKTEAAVRKFKKDENLGATQYGDVGPGTMRRLDELFTAKLPEPKPIFRIHDFVVVAKSFIRTVGNSLGIPKCPRGGGPGIPQFVALAKSVDAMMNETASDDQKDGFYRMFSKVRVEVTCAFANPPVVKISTVETDHGREGPIETPPLTVFDVSSSKGGKAFAWSVKGTPAPIAEPAFFAVCPRTSRFIWHHVAVEVDCDSLRIIDFSGSQFPTHRLFVDRALNTTIPQGPFANLWTPASGNPELVQ